MRFSAAILRISSRTSPGPRDDRHSVEGGGRGPPTRPSEQDTWKEFLRAHWDVVATADFFTVQVWTALGLVRYHVFFVVRLATREVYIARIIPEPHGQWMKQMARNLTDSPNGFMSGCRYLIHDRASLFSEDFRMILKAAGVEPVRLPGRSPDLNAFAERFVRSIREACLGRMVLIGESSLRRTTSHFVLHYHAERNHQGLGNRLSDRNSQSSRRKGLSMPHAAGRTTPLLLPRSRVTMSCRRIYGQ